MILLKFDHAFRNNVASFSDLNSAEETNTNELAIRSFDTLNYYLAISDFLHESSK